MNQLSPMDTKLFYDTFRMLLDYANRKFHMDDKVDLARDESLNPEFCKKVANQVWKNLSVIDELLKEGNLTEEQRSLLASWKNCVYDTFFVERHLKNGSIFIGSGEKVYQVIGLTDPLDQTFMGVPLPFATKATLLPFGNVIITDGLYEIYPVSIGGGIKTVLKNTYIAAKNNDQIIRWLPEEKQGGEVLQLPKEYLARKPGEKAASAKKGGTSSVYRLRVYPKGYGRSVYRTIEIGGESTLEKLCGVILDSFDFDREHLYEFCMDNKMYGHDSYQSDPEYDERSVRISLDRLRLIPGQKFSLHYDFGNDWMFIIRMESVVESPKKIRPRIIDSIGTIEQYW